MTAPAALLLAFSFLTTCPAWAQEAARYELGAAYAHMRVDSSRGSQHLDGLSVSLARNVTDRLAIVGDLGGYHLEGFRLGTYLFGPRFTAGAGQRVSAFGQALVGGAHANAGGRGFPSYGDSVALAFGGGFDYRVSDRLAVRLTQAEYLQTRLGSSVQHNLRVGAGIVLRFGTL